MTTTIVKPHDIALSKLVNGVFPDLFTDIVGQEGPKNKISHYLRSYVKTRRMPNLIFISPKGNGKTKLARQIANGLIKFDDNSEIELNNDTQLPRRKKFIEINCASLPKNTTEFLTDYMIPFVQDKKVTLFFDEASDIPHSVSMALLTILDPNAIVTNYTYGQYVCQFDFRLQTWMFATSEPQKVFHALLDRLKRIDLQEYNLIELAQIIQKGSPKVQYENGVLDAMALVSRGNARNASDLAAEVKTYLGSDDGQFTLNQWHELKGILSIQPLGLNITEINLLKQLEANPAGVSLTALSAKMGLSRESVQRDIELYLLKHSLIAIEPAVGRILTQKGREVLQNVA